MTIPAGYDAGYHAGSDPAREAGDTARGAELAIGGIPVERLAARAGVTPFFAYSRDQVSQRVATLRATLPEPIQLSYAIKANPMPALLAHLAGLVDGLDVASGGELKSALDTTMPADRISFAGPGKTTAELAQAVAAGVLIEIESAGELERLRTVSPQAPRIAIRINPDFAVRGAGVRLGGGPAQFGVDVEAVPALLERLSGDEFEGFHVFAGSQNLNADSICEAQRRTVEMVQRLADQAPGPIRHLNIGGGFGIPYSARDQPLDLEPIAENLAKLLDAQIPATRVIIELGRYLVGEAGVYVTRIVDRKQSRGKTFLVVDGGLHHQLAATGHLGQGIRRNYPLAVATKWSQPAEETVDVVGCLCTSLDLLGADVQLPRAEVGDLVAVFQAGAYGRSASPTDFLGHPVPPELLV